MIIPENLRWDDNKVLFYNQLELNNKEEIIKEILTLENVKLTEGRLAVEINIEQIKKGEAYYILKLLDTDQAKKIFRNGLIDRLRKYK